MPARAIIIGLDGADPTLIDRWCADGGLPEIGRLRADAASGRIATPPGLGDDAVWPGFYFGTPVGANGRYFWTQLQPGTDRLMLSRDIRFDGEPFWTRLSEAGKRVAVIDVPKCPVAMDLNGIHLCDWLVHGRDYARPTSYPREFAAEVVGAFGAPPPSICSEFVSGLDAAAIASIRRNLLAACDMKRRAALHFLARSDWDVFVTVFKESHCATHLLWHLVDPVHPEYRPGLDDRLGNPLKAVYQALDAAVGELVAAAGPRASVLLFTPLGSAANFTGEHLVDTIVDRINGATDTPFGGLRRAMNELTRLSGRQRTPRASDIVSALPHNEASAAIRVRVAGRDPNGRIRPGDEHVALCNELAGDLRRMTDPATGRRIVAEVIQSREAFRGARSGDLPDLFVVWDRGAPIDAAWSPRLGRIAGKQRSDRRSGNHVPGGAYFIGGAARDNWGGDGPVDIGDLARRFLAAADVPFT